MGRDQQTWPTLLPWARAAGVTVLVAAADLRHGASGNRSAARGRDELPSPSWRASQICWPMPAWRRLTSRSRQLCSRSHFTIGQAEIRESRFRRVVVPGIWFGVALLAKASTMIFGPLCMAVIEAERWLSSPLRASILSRSFANSFAMPWPSAQSATDSSSYSAAAIGSRKRRSSLGRSNCPTEPANRSWSGSQSICGFSAMPAKRLFAKSSTTCAATAPTCSASNTTERSGSISRS